jgi:flavin reductase (DIM6/NTAB) family NADH-FMN oxidoreductase RutF
MSITTNSYRNNIMRYFDTTIITNCHKVNSKQMEHLGIKGLFDSLDPVLWLITAQSGSRRTALIATFVSPTPINNRQPHIIAGISRHHFTHELAEASGTMALHLITEEHMEWVWRFGAQSGRFIDKLANMKMRQSKIGNPILTEAMGWLDCEIEDSLNIADRTLFVLRVREGGLNQKQTKPLSLKRMKELAPPDRLRRLEEVLEHDGITSTPNVQAWMKNLGPGRTL